MIIPGNSFDNFKAAISNSRLIVFGAGRFLRTVNENFKELELATKIEYLIDNCAEKEGTYYSLGHREIEIHSVDYLLHDSHNVTVLIVNRYDSYDMYNQLQGYKELDKVKCFFASTLIAKNVDDVFEWSDNLVIDSKKTIPKVIHCFWFSDEEKDEISSRCLESWKTICPDYEIIEWNTHNYDVTKNKFMYDAFKAKKWAFVSDYARMDVLNKYGGIYFDLDVQLIKRPDVLLNNDSFIGYGPIRDIEAAAFGSVSNSRITTQMLEIYEKIDFPKDLTKLVVQPVYLNKLFKENGIIIDGKYKKTDYITLFPRNVFSARNWFTGEIETDESSIGIHHCAGGWTSSELKEKKKMGQINNKKLELLYS